MSCGGHGTVPVEWQTRVDPYFQRRDWRLCSNYQDIMLLSLPGKAYFRVLERWVWQITAGVWDTRAADVSHPVVVQPKSELCSHPWHKVTHVFSRCWTPPRLSLLPNPVCDIHQQDLKVLFRWGIAPLLFADDIIGFIRPWPLTHTGVVCSQVWSNWDGSQNLWAWGDGSQLKNGGLLHLGWGLLAYLYNTIKEYNVLSFILSSNKDETTFMVINCSNRNKNPEILTIIFFYITWHPFRLLQNLQHS